MAERFKKIPNLILIFFFTAMLLSPAFDNIFLFTEKIPLNEGRTYAKAPTISEFRKSPVVSLKQFDKFYNDYFGMRKFFIKADAFLKYKLFNVSINKDVVIGKNGWFYLSNLINCKNTVPFSEKELKEWKEYLEDRYYWAKDNGIVYIFAISPEKVTVYPEYLPYYSMTTYKKKADQLIDYMKKESEFRITELAPALISAKKIMPTYFKKDSHWNPFGAFIAYKKIAEESADVYPELIEDIIPNYEFYFAGTSIKQYNDLIKSTGLEGLEKNDDAIILKEKTINYKTVFEKDKNQAFEIIITSTGNKKPNILLMGDSFAKQLMPFISNTADKAVYLFKGNYSTKDIINKTIKENNIKIIIEEITERIIQNYPIPRSFNEIKGYAQKRKGK